MRRLDGQLYRIKPMMICFDEDGNDTDSDFDDIGGVDWSEQEQEADDTYGTTENDSGLDVASEQYFESLMDGSTDDIQPLVDAYSKGGDAAAAVERGFDYQESLMNPKEKSKAMQDEDAYNTYILNQLNKGRAQDAVFNNAAGQKGVGNVTAALVSNIRRGNGINDWANNVKDIYSRYGKQAYNDIRKDRSANLAAALKVASNKTNVSDKGKEAIYQQLAKNDINAANNYNKAANLGHAALANGPTTITNIGKMAKGDVKSRGEIHIANAVPAGLGNGKNAQNVVSTVKSPLDVAVLYSSSKDPLTRASSYIDALNNIDTDKYQVIPAAEGSVSIQAITDSGSDTFTGDDSASVDTPSYNIPTSSGYNNNAVVEQANKQQEINKSNGRIGLSEDPNRTNYDVDDWNRGMTNQSSELVSDKDCKTFILASVKHEPAIANWMDRVASYYRH